MLLDALDVHLRENAAQIAPPVWEGLTTFVEAAIEHRNDPDQGIWEIRGDPQQFTASKVLCWVAVDRGSDLALARGDNDRATRWRAAADDMKAEILEKGVDERGRFRQHYANDELDAALLLIPIMGFLPPDDERVKATVLAIADELTQDDLVLRYRVDSTDTGFEGEEGTFTIRSFWLVAALVMIGEMDRAKALVQQALAVRRPAAPLRRGDRHHDRGASREFPPGLHPSGPRSTPCRGSSSPRNTHQPTSERRPGPSPFIRWRRRRAARQDRRIRSAPRSTGHGARSSSRPTTAGQ